MCPRGCSGTELAAEPTIQTDWYTITRSIAVTVACQNLVLLIISVLICDPDRHPPSVITQPPAVTVTDVVTESVTAESVPAESENSRRNSRRHHHPSLSLTNSQIHLQVDYPSPGECSLPNQLIFDQPLSPSLSGSRVAVFSPPLAILSWF